MRAVTLNLDCGGTDPDGSEHRLHTHADFLRDQAPDVLALQECTFWDEQQERRLLLLCAILGMAPVLMVRDHIGDGRNHTALLYRPDRLRLIGRRALGVGVFHHALIQARLRPIGAGDDNTRDLLVLATHFTHTDGESRLRESRWTTDYAGPFPGAPKRGMLMGDLNCSGMYDEDPDWNLVPRNLHARYRFTEPDGGAGWIDRRAIHVLHHAGWHDPQRFTGRARAATVGYAYENEPVPLRLDHILTRGLTVRDYRTHDTPEARAASDHLPVVLDADMP
ncbi:endonuclease/exonuclease/phosphatase [Streptomyces regensis]|nr:endonuclease/exonuclease/phosphatase [Streptomyces regensis]